VRIKLRIPAKRGVLGGSVLSLAIQELPSKTDAHVRQWCPFELYFSEDIAVKIAGRSLKVN